MKAKLFLLSFMLIGVLYQAFGQCAPDPNCTDPEGDGEVCPTAYPNAVENMYYDQVTTIICPATAQGQQIHHVELLSVGNLPTGITYQCQDDNCVFYPGVARCANVYGTPEIGTWGYYNISISVEAFVSLFGNPVSVGEFTDSSARIFVEPYLRSDFELTMEDNNTLCYDKNYVVTYTGNAEASANYHWNFGSANIISGEGQGPYIISYPEAGGVHTDSISLYVEQEAFTSPVHTKQFDVTFCLGIEGTVTDRISIQPNPCHNHLKINNVGGLAYLQIYTIGGDLVYHQSIGSQLNEIDLSTLPIGMYFVKIYDSQSHLVQKIIKQ